MFGDILDDMQDDSEILKEIRGDKKSFSKLYIKYYDTIYKYLYFRTSYNKELAQDYTSETFLSALKYINKVQLTQHTSILPWLYTIARNTLNQEFRKVQSTVTLENDNENSLPNDYSDMESEAEIGYEAKKIENILNTLPKISQDIVYMKTYSELTFSEIATILEMGESAVKMQYYRSIEEVTKLLK